MPEDLVFAAYPAFQVLPEGLVGIDRDVATKELQAVVDEFAERVKARGIYSTAGFSAETDLLFWLVASNVDDVQDMTVALRRTQVGRACVQTHAFLGLVRAAEFAPDHVPAFLSKPPRKYVSVYPFVRTPEWYLLDPKERGRHLSSHGELGRQFPDVDPNTTSAFGLGDYEWILAFEADSVDRLVDLIRALRANESRLYVKEETPFITGIRKELADALADLTW